MQILTITPYPVTLRPYARVYGLGVPNLPAKGLGRRCDAPLEPNRVSGRSMQTEPAEWLTEALLGHGKNLIK